MKRCGLYVRVSSLDQSTDLQRRELTEYCQRRGWTIAKIYEDKASGTSARNRKMLEELLRDCRRHHVSVVLVWKLDRLFRSLKMMIEYLNSITSAGVDFISMTDGIDLSQDSPAARLQLHLLSAFGEFEASLIRSRVIAGLAAAKARGQKLGRPPKVNGELVRQVLELRRQNVSIRQIAARVGLAKSTCQRILESCTDKPIPAASQNPSDLKGSK